MLPFIFNSANYSHGARAASYTPPVFCHPTGVHGHPWPGSGVSFPVFSKGSQKGNGFGPISEWKHDRRGRRRQEREGEDEEDEHWQYWWKVLCSVLVLSPLNPPFRPPSPSFSARKGCLAWATMDPAHPRYPCHTPNHVALLLWSLRRLAVGVERQGSSTIPWQTPNRNKSHYKVDRAVKWMEPACPPGCPPFWLLKLEADKKKSRPCRHAFPGYPLRTQYTHINHGESLPYHSKFSMFLGSPVETSRLARTGWAYTYWEAY